MLKKICILSSYYPSEKDPHYAFVGTLIGKIADLGIECHVISPVSNMEKKHRADTRTEITEKGSRIYVYCPRYFQYPSRNLFGFQTYKLTVFSKWNSIWKVYKKKICSCDAIYSHFIESGVDATWLKKRTRVPAFMAVGESDIISKCLTYKTFRNLLYDNLNGIISVSTQLKELLNKFDIVDSKIPILVSPNGIDTEIFKKRDKIECRKALGINEKDFVISFVGGFIKRKGFDILQDVLENHPDWKCILIGSGDIPIKLKPEQVIFVGRLSHIKIPDYISASDVFVLPSKSEGCCNAIIEAMGCGLPIVSSDLTFNYDILNHDNAILIDPNKRYEIEHAIKTIKLDVKTRLRLETNSFHTGHALSIDNRAKEIIKFMEMNL